MVKALRNSKIVFNKGGVFYLLYFFFILNAGIAQEIIYDKDADSPSYGQISIRGLSQSFIDQLAKSELSDRQWSTFFRTVVQGSTRPMLGSYLLEGNEIHFKPRFLPDPEISYITTFSSKSLNQILPNYPIGKDLSTVINFKGHDRGINQVTKIFPESDLLPANVLRFYIHFSQPSDFQNPFHYIHIENEKGEIIAEPFVEMDEGLWSMDRKRLTVLIHPGRIKRNVGPNMTMGEVFEEGQTYKLVVSEKWNLAEEFVKPFKITAALRTRIDIERWEINSPRSGSRDDLTVKTDRLLDNALSERLITIWDANGNSIEGDFNYSAKESKLIFTPEEEWQSSSYLIDVNTKLEDVCGNTLQRVFDVEGEGIKEKPKKFQISFIVKK